ncbi:MAG: FlgD immunoglobulin-like domain containing protein [candidate division KSB1 bacterium]|nr:FlgD immunoglobulin-like domain containing protein [candidate division KSB1 bacterium]
MASDARLVAEGTLEEPIRFYRLNADYAWDQVELSGNNNSFEYCVFNGGTWNVHVVNGTGNCFENCTFMNGVRGFYASGNVNQFVLDKCLVTGNSDIGVYATQCWAGIKNSTITANGGQGIRILSGKLGYYTPGYFTNNYIYGNEGHGIGVKGDLYLGYGSTPGNNLIFNNGGEAEIKVENYFGSHVYQSSYGGLSDIFDDDLGYYIYNASASSVNAVDNFWGTENGPEGGNARFQGNVSWSPFKDEPQTYTEIVGMHPGLQKRSANQFYRPEYQIIPKQVASENRPDCVNTAFTRLEKRMMELINLIASNEYDSNTSTRILELYQLSKEDPEDKLGLKQQIKVIIRDKSNKGKDFYKNSLNYKNLSSEQKKALQYNAEIAMLAEIDEKIQDYQLQLALAESNPIKSDYDRLLNDALALLYDVKPFIKADDHFREFLDFEVSLLQWSGRYKEAHKCLIKLIKHVEKNNIEGYSYSDTYELWEEDLLYVIEGNSKIGKYGSKDTTINSKTVPSCFALSQNYPNPFNPETHITYNIPEADQVVIDIYDIQGRKVSTLLNRTVEAGQHSVSWHGKDDYGNQVASGMYLYQIRYQDRVATRKMLFMR